MGIQVPGQAQAAPGQHGGGMQRFPAAGGMQRVPGAMCSIAGCGKPTFDGQPGYCSRAHKGQGDALQQAQAPQQGGGGGLLNWLGFGGGGGQQGGGQPGGGQPGGGFQGRRAMAYKFGDEIRPGDSKFEDIKKQFEDKWDDRSGFGGGGGKPPTIDRMYCVSNPSFGLEAKHDTYCQKIGNVKVKGHGKDPGNQQRRFHQTQLNCNYNGQPCNDSGCAVCSIIKTGFQMKFVGGNAGSRFGSGLYSSSTASKAYYYGNKKGMFVVNVACGVADVNQASGPLPPGTHSRVANAQDDELIVFDDAAMVPRWLMVFK